MRGLFEKDMCLLFHRKQTIIVFLVVAIFMSIAVDGAFFVGYLTMLSAIFALSTLSYDEYDNGYAFLMTMPFDRKTYVKEKYLFCLVMGALAMCIAIVLYAVVRIANGTASELAEELPGLISTLPVMFMAAVILIPLQLKFGAEKSRVVLFVFFGAVAAIALVAKRAIDVPDGAIKSLVRFLDSAPPAAVVGVIVAACALVTLISYLFSVRIMAKKEF